MEICAYLFGREALGFLLYLVEIFNGAQAQIVQHNIHKTIYFNIHFTLMWLLINVSKWISIEFKCYIVITSSATLLSDFDLVVRHKASKHFKLTDTVQNSLGKIILKTENTITFVYFRWKTFFSIKAKETKSISHFMIQFIFWDLFWHRMAKKILISFAWKGILLNSSHFFSKYYYSFFSTCQSIISVIVCKQNLDKM